MTRIHEAMPAFAAWSGPRDAKIVLLGEAWGQSEEMLRQPFCGESGKELWRMMGEALPEVAPELHFHAAERHRYGLAWVRERGAWLAAAGIAMTNVLAFRPPNNKLEALCGGAKEVSSEAHAMPPVTKGKYLHAEYLPELRRLHDEIMAYPRNLVVALGNTACWAALQATNIGSIRGTVAPSAVWPGIKVLPTYHPAGVLRQWSWRPIVCMDLMKAWREGQFPEIRRPERRVVVDPSLDECMKWSRETIAMRPQLLACDIETGAGQIKCVGFARSASEAFVFPFVDLARPGGSFWSHQSDERRAWDCVGRLLASPIPKVFQNGMYDLQYLMRMGLRIEALREDTMLLHHSLWPEMQKGLGFLGSVYTNEASWKLMRREPETMKRDE